MTTYAPPEVRELPTGEPVVGNYFVAAYPPFSAWNSNDVLELKAALNQPSSGPLGLYVHIPFCQKKCDFCYYLSYADQKIGTVNRYLEAVVHELEIYSKRRALRNRQFSFAYFGGGTPSLLTPDQVKFLGEGLRGLLDWNQVEEITFEVAPRSVRPEFLEALRELGVNRISMGVQSFDDTLLKMNGRIHLSRDVVRAYEMIRGAGFASVNIDLMCGLIGETPTQWRETVHRALTLSPDSITIYQTEVPHNTQLFRDWREGRIRELPSWEIKRTRLLYGFHALERAGYTVVSAYNAVKEPELHHFKYQDYFWRGADMLALGVGAFGYLGHTHFQNAVTLDAYLSAVENEKLPLHRAYALGGWDQLVREFVLQLKFGEVDARYFSDKFGVNISEMFAKSLEKLAAEGLLIFSRQGVRLTRAGLLRVDLLLKHFYDPQFRDVRYT